MQGKNSRAEIKYIKKKFAHPSSLFHSNTCLLYSLIFLYVSIEVHSRPVIAINLKTDLTKEQKGKNPAIFEQRQVDFK